MGRDVIVIGMGQMGSLLAEGFRLRGRAVHTVARGDDPARVAGSVPDPQLALVAVAEDDLAPVLVALPARWKLRAGLLQNELVPRVWENAGIRSPTVLVAWFERKGGNPSKPLLPSPVYGPAAGLVLEALLGLGLPTRRLASEAELRAELVRKNVYILTTNLAGLVVGGTVGRLWTEHRDLALQIAREVIAVQEALVGDRLDVDGLLADLAAAIAADPEHPCAGRTARRRLERTLEHARAAGVAVPRLQALAEQRS